MKPNTPPDITMTVTNSGKVVVDVKTYVYESNSEMFATAVRQCADELIGSVDATVKAMEQKHEGRVYVSLYTEFVPKQ